MAGKQDGWRAHNRAVTGFNGKYPPLPPPRLSLTRARARILVDLIALLFFFVSYLVIPVRLGHIAVGYGLAVVVLVHLAQHWPATCAGGTGHRAGAAAGHRGRRAVRLGRLTTASGAWQQSDNSDTVRNWHPSLGTAPLLLILGHAWRRRQALRNWRRARREHSGDPGRTSPA